MADIGLENLIGTIEEITYFNSENGYTVMVISSEGEPITVVGSFPELAEGVEVRLMGEWVNHSTYGNQFKASLIEQTLPENEAGILRYLASGIIKGIREATAVKIVEAFGREAFDVIENDVDRLSSIKGISKPKARKIQQEFKAQLASRETITALTKIGLSQAEAFQAYNLFQSAAYDIISDNPFAFVCENGYSFERAEEIADNLNSPDLFDYRCQACVTYIVRHNLDNGHTCLPRMAVLKSAMNYLECSEDAAEIAIDNALQGQQLVSAEINGKEFLFTPEIYDAETAVADRIKVMVNYPPRQIMVDQSEIFTFEQCNHIEFDDKQRAAIEIAVNQGMLILTGGPGTGKTTTVRGIIALMKNRGMNVALAAPTGRAAKRMSELTGFEAKTINRLLEVEYKDGATEPSFVYNRKNKLDVDAVIIDELSMVDIKLFDSFLEALPMSARLIMVGDKDQLPAVGAGNVLKDLTESGLIPVVELDKIFRQAMESLIVTNAHEVVRGNMPDMSHNDIHSDFFLLRENAPYNASKKIVDLVTRRLPTSYGYDVFTDIQVLCPSRKGDVGTENLNFLLQQKLNPASREKAEIKHNGYVLREGDKVMQIKNNYDVPWFKSGENGTGVFNGDIGILTNIDKANDILNVTFEDREAMYSLEHAKQLELAYAMTVHKSQGSEFEAVVMPVLATPQKLSYRNLFYTALTRAKNLIVLVGNENSVRAMVENDKETRRYSALLYFLTVDNNPFLE
ncbi:MAG: ATP-dependent RecD-like DNA helicase [Eubacterium sp.]|nr:ATP-dependent RecD-like DNA helicase [Eubacterium sp.]